MIDVKDLDCIFKWFYNKLDLAKLEMVLDDEIVKLWERLQKQFTEKWWL